MNDGDPEAQTFPLKSQLPPTLLDAERSLQSGTYNPKQDLDARIVMREADIRDAALVESSIKACDLFANYVDDCNNVEKAEFNADLENTVEEAERKVKIAGEQWQDALRQLRKSFAHTPSGVLAKARVVEGYFVEYPTDDEIMRLMHSILKDLENLF